MKWKVNLVLDEVNLYINFKLAVAASKGAVPKSLLELHQNWTIFVAGI